jgi:uncharacterized protein (DUF486 family)
MNKPAGPLRPAAPAPVLNAVKLMYAAAAVSTVTLIISVTLIGDAKAALRTANPSLTAAQVRDLNGLITLAIVSGLVVIALWLWMARANGQGRNWARILATVLFGLATLELIRQYPSDQLGHLVLGGQVQPVIHYGSGVTMPALIVPALTWLAGLAAVWLLWRPASSAFFNPQGRTQAGHSG